MATQSEIESHYDVDNDFFALFLDEKYRIYTCAMWGSASNLEQAQVVKLDRMCSYANVKSGDMVMDVGCGWGGLMSYVVENYSDALAYGITISREQYNHVIKNARAGVSVGLTPWQSYQIPDRKFDAIISVCAFEHFASLEDQVASRQREIYTNFFDWCLSISTENAQVALQVIVITRLPNNLTELRDTKFLLNEVFPGSALPTISDIQAAIIDRYEISAANRIGSDYVRTLTEWKTRLELNKDLAISKYGLDTYEHHVAYFEAACRCFESGYTDLYQVSLKRAKPTRILSK